MFFITLFLIGLALYGATIFSLAIPIATIEKTGSIVSLKRSLQLTRGARWPILGLVLLLGAIDLVVRYLLMVLPDGIADYTDLAWAIFYYPLVLSTIAIAYQRLRSLKEGEPVETLATIFD